MRTIEYLEENAKLPWQTRWYLSLLLGRKIKPPLYHFLAVARRNEFLATVGVNQPRTSWPPN